MSIMNLVMGSVAWTATATGLAFVAGISGHVTPCGINALGPLLGPDGPTRDRWRRFAAFSGGLALGGGILLSVLMAIHVALARLVPELLDLFVILLALVSLTYLISGLLGKGIRTPTLAILVPRRWAFRGPSTFAFLFGLMLGVGFLTIVSFIGSYIFMGMSIVGSPRTALWAVAAFIFGRWLMAAMTMAAVRAVPGLSYSRSRGPIVSALYRIDVMFGPLRALALIAVFAVAVASVLGIG